MDATAGSNVNAAADGDDAIRADWTTTRSERTGTDNPRTENALREVREVRL